jgi:hypothetical protein
MAVSLTSNDDDDCEKALMTDPTDEDSLTISQVINALGNTAARSRINPFHADDDHLKRSSIAWDDAMPILEGGLAHHKMSRGTFERAWHGMQEAPEHLKGRITELLDAWRIAHWPSIRDVQLSEAEVQFGNYDFTGARLREKLEMWPELRGERALLEQALLKLRRAGSGSAWDEALGNLAELRGDEAMAKDAVAVILAQQRHYSDGDKIAGLLDSWVGASTWGSLMSSLWASIPEERHKPADITRLAYHLRQLPLVTGPSLDGFRLAEMSGASRAAWRRSLRELLSGDAELERATTEALLWLSDPQEDLFAQFTALQINDPDPRSALTPLLSHPSRLTELRARSALELLSGAPDPLETLLTRDEPLECRPEAPPASRTWLGDARLEQLLRTAFADAASSMAAEVSKTASSGEENLVGKLFERLRGACVRVTEQAAILARETDRGERLTVALSHRVIGKTEEGNPGLVATRRFSTDVTLIVRARKGAAPPFSERATFVQAKRLLRGTPPETDHYKVSMEQMRDISAQTTSAFLLAVGPSALGVTMPVVPAQLLLDRFGPIVKTKHLHPDALSRHGRGLAGWLVDDVIGLWTGDPGIEAVQKASEGAGDCDTLLVEIDVTIVPMGSEGESRKS